MTAQHAAYLLLAALALASLAWYAYEAAGKYVAKHVEAALAPDPFFTAIDDLRADFEPAETPLLDRIAELMAPQVIAEAEALLEMGQ